jgi:hypothetical protein
MSHPACPRWPDVTAAVAGDLDHAATTKALQHAANCERCASEFTGGSDSVPALVATPAPLHLSRLSLRERRWLGGRSTRWLLLVAAVVIVVASIPSYIGGDGLSPDSHAARHLASWQIGFGVGLFVAAAISRMSAALLALAITFATLTIAARIIDVVGGHHGPWFSSVHLVELIGVLLLWLLTPPHLLPRWRPGRSRAPADGRQLRPVTDTDSTAT